MLTEIPKVDINFLKIVHKVCADENINQDVEKKFSDDFVKFDRKYNNMVKSLKNSLKKYFEGEASSKDIFQIMHEDYILKRTIEKIQTLSKKKSLTSAQSERLSKLKSTVNDPVIFNDFEGQCETIFNSMYKSHENLFKSEELLGAFTNLYPYRDFENLIKLCCPSEFDGQAYIDYYKAYKACERTMPATMLKPGTEAIIEFKIKDFLKGAQELALDREAIEARKAYEEYYNILKTEGQDFLRQHDFLFDIIKNIAIPEKNKPNSKKSANGVNDKYSTEVQLFGALKERYPFLVPNRGDSSEIIESKKIFFKISSI